MKLKVKTLKNHYLKVYAVIFILSVLYISACNLVSENSNDQYQTISANIANELINKHENDENIVLLDVRTPGEYSEGHLKNSILIDYHSGEFKDRLKELSRDKTYLLYCRSGNRSGKTMKIMRKLNFNKVYNVKGGISKLKEAGFILEK